MPFGQEKIVRVVRRDKKSKPSKPSVSVLVGIVEISRAERVGAKFPAYPCSSVLIRGRLNLLAAEQCWRSGRVVYVVFLTNHTPHFSWDG